jgi:hypothetical protein
MPDVYTVERIDETLRGIKSAILNFEKASSKTTIFRILLSEVLMAVPLPETIGGDAGAIDTWWSFVLSCTKASRVFMLSAEQGLSANG